MRLIGTDGKQLGVVPIDKAIELAVAEGLDLVEVAPQVDPPVCKIMDYGRYKYQLSKKTQEAKKKQTVIQVKEIKIRPKTDEHDFQTKIRHIKRFLGQKDKAKVTVVLKGREVMYKEQGYQVLERIGEVLRDDAVVEQSPKEEGKNIVMVLAPKKE